ncbi:ATPase, T2SS/T4P/T4SS family [Janthinobacterium agaricidamnosum]|uniref:Type II/IV secretion system family protein n=1 Tax=Janthinobacterium agaricidamnosum NBRC 102515 = DSM 9628 TaxID=1349767 RepID=W0V4Z3_9BURK|nr:ATPase, T2SS/T4P/T4SS family [Janthinobacterium agaricidamnosum]CDG82342.1 type II/IV secretion system family protein [Janthinobacterium agaricidamnosum NBRC 102515 = DSM 9628]
MLAATTVKELRFSELYLGHETLDDRFSETPGADVNILSAGPALRRDLDLLLAMCRDALAAVSNSQRCRVLYDGVPYHVSVMRTTGGTVFVLRRIAGTIPSLSSLGIPDAYLRRLQVRDMSGLFIISGPSKSGKTTTACALIKQRLQAFGGLAVTGEELIELPLEGHHGTGVCYQTTIGGQLSFREGWNNLMRSGAQIIFVDEIRDEESAAAVLRASMEGRLIITTIPADSAIQAIIKLDALAAERLAPASVKTLMADGLAGVLHQRLGRDGKQPLMTETLFLRDALRTRSILRDGAYDQLAVDIKQQMAAMISSYEPARRVLA